VTLTLTDESPATDRPLAGTWCVVLGASSGMGRAVARRVAADGAGVLGVHFDTAQRDDEVAALVDELTAHRVPVRFVNANAASPRTRAEVVDVLTGLGAGAGRTVLLHSLAFGSLRPFVAPPAAEPGAVELVEPKQLTMTVEVMAHSLVWWVRDLLEADLLPAGSHVLAMTSAGDSRVSPSYGAVSAAKSALLSHVRQLAVELAPRGVAVNALRAGVTRTPAFDRIPGSDAIARTALAANPHGRLTVPEDVADAVATLATLPSSWVTGNVVAVDGGEGLT